MQKELQETSSQTLIYIRITIQRLPGSPVPQHHGSSSWPLMNHTFRERIFDTMIFNLYRFALIFRTMTRASRNDPAFQYSVVCQSQIVVKTTRVMFLHREFVLLRRQLVVNLDLAGT